MEQAQAREDANPVTAGEARAALAALPSDTQQAVGQLASKHGRDARPYLADQATRDGWWPEERDALRTLTAATPGVRDEALQEAQTDGWITNGPTSSPSDGTGGDSVGAQAAFEGHGTDPRPVGDDVVTGAGGIAGDTSRGASETPEVAGADPGSPDRPSGQPKRKPPDQTGGMASPPESAGTNVRLPREPKDPDPYRN
jgi:hypothetical protein